MSPEVNGNPPSAIKRKKNKKMSNDSVPSCNYRPQNTGPFTTSYNSNLSIPDASNYYSVMDFSNASEPLSLPGYFPNYLTANGNFKFTCGAHNSSTPKQSNYYLNKEINDYASLPMTNLDQENGEISKRRYSDPGLPNEESDSSSDSVNNQKSDKLVHKLMNQVNVLKESNKRLSREVMEIRIELNLLRQQMLQQNNIRHCDREYEPGMLADVIREVRDAARVREDTLLAKVKYMLEEKQINMNHMHLVSEKNRSNDRITKLEEQIRNLSLGNKNENEGSSSVSNLNNIEEPYLNRSKVDQVLELERETLELRRELQDTRAKKEEADQRILILDKKLSNIIKRNDYSGGASDFSDNRKTSSPDSMSTTTVSSIVSHGIPRVTLSGPVTDL